MFFIKGKAYAKLSARRSKKFASGEKRNNKMWRNAVLHNRRKIYFKYMHILREKMTFTEVKSCKLIINQ